MLFSGTKVSDLSKISILLIVIGFLTIGVSIYVFADLASSVLEKEEIRHRPNGFRRSEGDVLRCTRPDLESRHPGRIRHLDHPPAHWRSSCISYSSLK